MGASSDLSAHRYFLGFRVAMVNLKSKKGSALQITTHGILNKEKTSGTQLICSEQNGAFDSTKKRINREQETNSHRDQQPR